MSKFGPCPGCNQSLPLMSLHGDKGGPLRCGLCAGKWHAEHTRRRRAGRIIIKAMNLFLSHGGKWTDLDRFRLFTGGDRFSAGINRGIDRLGQRKEGEKFAGADQLAADVPVAGRPGGWVRAGAISLFINLVIVGAESVKQLAGIEVLIVDQTFFRGGTGRRELEIVQPKVEAGL